jgi:hypothetical protein
MREERREVKRLDRSKSKWDDSINIYMYLKGIMSEWTDVYWNQDQCRIFVKSIMNLKFQKNRELFKQLNNSQLFEGGSAVSVTLYSTLICVNLRQYKQLSSQFIMHIQKVFCWVFSLLGRGKIGMRSIKLACRFLSWFVLNHSQLRVLYG